MTEGPIQRIRVTFHDYDVEEGLEYCRKVMENGYEVACNPINIMGYSDGELLEILRKVNEIHPTVFSYRRYLWLHEEKRSDSGCTQAV